MRFNRPGIALLCVLMFSLILNVLLGRLARDLYVAEKVRAAEPTFENRYRARNAALLAASGEPLIVVFGDSRARSWNPPPAVAGHRVINRGIGGETTAQMIHRFGADVVDLHPAVVIIEAGINDLVAASLSPGLARRFPGETASNLQQMVERARAAGIRVVLLTILPPRSPNLVRRFVWSDRIHGMVAEANARLRGLHDPPRVEVVDSARALQTPSGEWKPGVNAGSLHITSAGYRELNDAVLGVLAARS